MKTTIKCLIMVLLLNALPSIAQTTIEVQAKDSYISDNLNLHALATVFGESKNLEEFELLINDNENSITNLDLNNDEQIDYLRVIETTENTLHVIIIQAVIGNDQYQDIASIIVEKNLNNSTSVQIVGNPYFYGEKYIFTPTFVHTPAIYYNFRSIYYKPWHSPYYWGYYPQHYRFRTPYHISIYLNRVNKKIRHHNYSYYYSAKIRNDRAMVIWKGVSKNTYELRHPEHAYRSTRHLDSRLNYRKQNAVHQRYNNSNQHDIDSKTSRNSTNKYQPNRSSQTHRGSVNMPNGRISNSNSSIENRSHSNRSNEHYRSNNNGQSSTNHNSRSNGERR